MQSYKKQSLILQCHFLTNSPNLDIVLTASPIFWENDFSIVLMLYFYHDIHVVEGGVRLNKLHICIFKKRCLKLSEAFSIAHHLTKSYNFMTTISRAWLECPWWLLAFVSTVLSFMDASSHLLGQPLTSVLRDQILLMSEGLSQDSSEWEELYMEYQRKGIFNYLLLFWQSAERLFRQVTSKFFEKRSECNRIFPASPQRNRSKTKIEAEIKGSAAS